MARRTAAALAFLGGALLIYAGLSGNVGFWSTLEELVRPHVQDPAQRATLTFVIRILIVLASLGGFSVLAGGVLFLRDRMLLGKLLVFLGAASGLIGIVVGVALTLSQGGTLADYFTNQLNGTAGLVGVLVSYASRKVA